MLFSCWKYAAGVAALLGCVLFGRELAAWNITSEGDERPALVRAVDLLLYQMDLAVRTKRYDDATQEKIARHSTTAAVLMMALSQEENPHPLGQAAEKVVPLAEWLAENPKNQALAAETITRLRTLAADPPAGERIAARPVGKLDLLMKQVPEINNQLRRELAADGPEHEKAAMQAALSLAAVASVSSHDLSYCAEPAEELAWKAHCEELRLAASEIQAAIGRDKAEAIKGLARLTRSCDGCHAEFRD